MIINFARNKYNILIFSFFLIISVFYIYGVNRQYIFVNTDIDAFDQSAYIDYAKKLYEARNLNKKDLRNTYIEFATDFFEKCKDLTIEEQSKTLKLLLSDIYNNHYNLTDKDKKNIELVFINKIRTKSFELNEKDLLIIDKLIDSNSFIFGDALDGNRMPFYPLIQSFFYNKNINDYNFFKKGIIVNIILSFIFLIIIFYIFFKKFQFLLTLNNILIITFTVFIYKAPYFQCELLYYFLSFISFIYYIKSINDLNFINSIFAGFFTAISYLTKASILPGFMIFIIFLTIKHFKKYYNYKIYMKIFLIIVSFLSITSSFLIVNKNKFGSFFYNINTYNYMWKSSWDEIIKDDAVKISNKSFFDKKSTIDITKRITGGGIVLWKDFMSGYGYRKYLILYLSFLLFLFFKYKKIYLFYIKKNITLICFVLFFLITYSLLFSWYLPIGYGNRFILSIYIPALYSLSLSITYMNNQFNDIINQKDYSIFYSTVFVILVCDIFFILNYRIDKLFGGW